MRDVWGNGIEWNERLWRYLQVHRFVSMLQQRALYFAASTQFTDKFEGASAVMPPDFPVDPRYAEMDGMEAVNFRFRRLMKINCWHRSEHENIAMWNLYAGESKGIGITTTPDRLRNACTPFRLKPTYGVEDLWGGQIRYHDLTQVRLRLPGHQTYFCKHLPFYWEREFRLLISLMQPNEFGVDTPDDGILVGVNLDTLIESIMLGPSLTREEVETITEESRKAGLVDRICKSSMYGRPRFI